MNAKKQPWQDRVVSFAELQKEKFPPMTYVVPDIVPEGVTILAGRPKIGKSWLALELCLGVASGTPVLGNIEPATGDVLYLALEDNPRRIQRRINRIMPSSGRWPERCQFATNWSRLEDGGADEIAEWIDSVPEPRLVALDTLAAVRSPRQPQGNMYQADYGAIEKLQKLAGEKHLAILVLAHERKMEAVVDPIDAVSGTLGLTGSADGVAIIQRSAQGTTLYLRGRDIEEKELALVFDKARCRWSILGDAAEVQRSKTRKHVLEILLAATEPMSPKQVAESTEMRASAVKKQLERMANAGEVCKSSRSRYVHPERLDLLQAGTELKAAA